MNVEALDVPSDAAPVTDTTEEKDSDAPDTGEREPSSDTGEGAPSDRDSATSSETIGDTGTAQNTDSDTIESTDRPGDTGSDSMTERDKNTDLDTGTAKDTASEPPEETSQDTGTTMDTERDTVGSTDSPTDTAIGTETEVDTCPPPPAGASVVGPLADWESFGYADVSLTTVTGPGFDQAWRCDRVGETIDPTNSQLYADTTVDIAAGDTLLATFWVRCASSLTGSCRTGFIFEEAISPWTNAAEYYVVADSEWSMHQVPFVSPVDFTAGEAHGTFRLEYDDQAVEIYPAKIVNYGDTTEPACLPTSPGIWDSVTMISVPRTTAVADFKYIYRLEFNGRPEPEVTITGLPPWISFNGTRLLSGVPPYDALGLTGTISIIVENGVDSDTQEFQIDVVADPDLVAHWPLDETSGAVAYDASSRGNDGDLHGDPVWIPDEGWVAGALRFNGYDGLEDYVEIPNSAVLEDVQEGDYTLAAWVRPNSIPPSDVETDNDAAYGILIKEGNHLGLWYGNDRRFHGAHVFEAAPYELSSGVNAPGDYHHVAMRVNTTLGYMHLYVDGNYQQGQNFTPGEATLEYGTVLWRIGIGYPEATEYGMISDADIDDVRIYSRSLSEAEIQSLAGWD